MTPKIPWNRILIAAIPAVIGAGALIWQAQIIVDAKHDREKLESTIENLRAELSSAASQPEGNQCESEVASLREQLGRAGLDLDNLKAQIQACIAASGGPVVTEGSTKPGLRQTFETESYRLIADDVKRSGNTVRVTMTLETVGDEGVEFRARGWYLLDENGERWNEFRPDLGREEAGAAPFRNGVRLVSGTKIKDSLVFNAMGSSHGTNFTLVGVESEPQPRREIVLRGLFGSGG